MPDDNASAAVKKTNDDFVASVIQKLRDKVVSKACPFCQNLNWYLMDRVGAINILGVPEYQNTATYILACTNCGFVRQHVKTIVDGKITGETSYGPE